VRRKNTCWMLLIFMFMTSSASTRVNFASSDQQSALTIISINPEESVCDIDQYFTINISIADVWNLSIWKFDLSYDDGILYTNQSMIVVDPDEWFSQGGSIPDFPRVRVTPGNITVSDLLLDEEEGTSGNGTLAKVTFLVQATGNSTLHLHHTILYNPHWSPIDHALDDGFFRTPPAIISLSPATNVHNPGDYFTINISIANVTNLNMWEAKLIWDAELLDCINVIEGPFMSDFGPTEFFLKKMPGKIERVGVALWEVVANGNGTLARIQFQVKKPGSCKLDLYDTQLWNENLTNINHEHKDGFFHTTVPVAFFSYYPTDPDILELVTLNASVSYDPNGFISMYFWDFGDGSNETGTDKVIVTHIYGEYENFEVKLAITDNETETTTYTDTIKIQKNVAVHSVELPYPHYNISRSGAVVEIPVVVGNLGTMTVDFNVTLYYNGTSLPDNPTPQVFNPIPIEELSVDNLWGTQTYLPPDPRAGTNTTRELTFKWNTAGVSNGNYTFMAIIKPLAGENDTKDNVMISYTNKLKWDALVEVSGKAGDVDGDGDVDSMDLFTLAAVYGTKTGDPLYNPNCDFDNDGDVDSMDLFTLGANYGT